MSSSLRALARLYVAGCVAGCVVGCVAGCVSSSPRLHARAPDDVARLAEGAPFTVVEFFSAHCPVQRAHDDRLRSLFALFSPRGVRFVAVDSEADASRELDEREARARGFAFPILSDPDGRFADALGVESATETIVLDADGRIRFHGGIDSDRTHLTDDARRFLRDALESLLRGDEPADPMPKSLGCALRRK